MSMATELRDIVAKHSLTWPEEYLALAESGLNAVSPKADDSTDGDSQELPHHPLLHFSTSFETLGPAQIADHLARLAEPDDMWRIDPAAGLLPFGMQADGNLYCFHTGAAEGGSVQVVLLQNDDDEDLRLAPDLAGFVFADMIESAAEFYDDDPLGEDDPEHNAAGWLRSHERLLTDEQAAAVGEVFGRSLIERDDDSMGFLEFDDVDEVVEPVLRYPARNEPIQLWDRSNWHQG